LAAVVAVPRFLQHQMRQGYDLSKAHEASEASVVPRESQVSTHGLISKG
jgi:hypothetical protein